jgi:predicted amidohydrolase YtcJ
MMQSKPLVLRNVERNGAHTNVRIADGVIHSIGEVSEAEAELIDARGGALIPGLIDHHIHLFATAARLTSIDLSAARSKEALVSALRTASADHMPDAWLRAINYDDSEIGLISRADLDAANVSNPVRVQDRTGALWILNSHALALVLDDAPPPCVERDANGDPTGRIWRGDAWLRTRMPSAPPSLAPLSRALAAYGVTGVTDTSASNGHDEARLFANARMHGELLQSLCMMSGGDIPASPHYTIGPIKILPDERELPELDDIIEHMRMARSLNRAVAVHCVTAAELVFALAAYEAIGAKAGDRLEHGGIIPHVLLEQIRALGLIIVTQPNFIHDRGDRYARTIDNDELPDLYRLRSLREASIQIAAGGDAPYGDFNPWRAIKTATDRKTKNGIVLGAAERIGAREALGLYLGGFDTPARERKIEIGASADLCLLKTPLSAVLENPHADHVAATIARGQMIYSAL